MSAPPSSDDVDWLLFLGRPTLNHIWSWHESSRRGPNPLSSFAVPYGVGKVEPGDTIYLIGVNWPGTRFQLVGRIDVRTATPVARDTRDTVLVVAKRGSATRTKPIITAARSVDKLRFLHNDGSMHRVKRNADGSIELSQFAGRANLRELVVGADILGRELSRAAGLDSPAASAGRRDGVPADNARL